MKKLSESPNAPPATDIGRQRESATRTIQKESAPTEVDVATSALPGPLSAEASRPAADDRMEAHSGTAGSTTEPDSRAGQPSASSDSQRPLTASGDSSKAAVGTKEPRKRDPATLEQFIENAYSRKGRRLSCSRAVEVQLSSNLVLSDDAFVRLNQLAQTDLHLSVARQLLLLTPKLKNTGLRLALSGFATTAMLRHPAFGSDEMQHALRANAQNEPELDALKQLGRYQPAEDSSGSKMNTSGLSALHQALRETYLIWLATTRGFSLERLAGLLYEAVWSSQAQLTANNTDRLLALIELKPAAGAGIACAHYRQQAADARSHQERAQRETMALRDQTYKSEASREQAVSERDAFQRELESRIEHFGRERESLRSKNGVEVSALRNL